MRIEELRIGNCYKLYADGKYYYYQIVAKDFISDNIRNFEPIELTEEWLLKLGFQKSKLEYWDQNVYKKDMFVLDESFSMMDIDISVNFKTVHHLQNTFFSLTGEELTIK